MYTFSPGEGKVMLRSNNHPQGGSILCKIAPLITELNFYCTVVCKSVQSLAQAVI